MKKTESKKLISIFVILAIALGNAGSTLYLPALLIIKNTLTTTSTLMKLSLSLYLVTFGLSQLIYGPLSDAFGRRINLIAGLSIFFFGSLLTSFSASIEVFLLGRIIQGLGMGTSSGVGFALIRDIYDGNELTKQLSYLSVFVGMTPIIAPLFGGYLTQYLGWRSCFITLAILALALSIAKFLFLPETNINLDRKACHPHNIIKNYHFLLKSHLFLGFLLITSLGFSSLMVINEMLPFMITKSLGLSPTTYGWLSICTGGGYFSGAFVSGILSAKFTKSKILLIGASIPLAILLIGLSIALFYFNEWVIIIPISIALFGIGFIVPMGTSGAMEPFPKMAGSESALLGSSMFFISSIFTALSSILPEQSQIPMFLFLLALGILTLLPLFLLKEVCC